MNCMYMHTTTLGSVQFGVQYGNTYKTINAILSIMRMCASIISVVLASS